MAALPLNRLLADDEFLTQLQSTGNLHNTLKQVNQTQTGNGDAGTLENTTADSQVGNGDDEDDAKYSSDGDEDLGLVVREPSKPRKISQKKKIEQVNFAKWLNNNRQSLSKKAAAQPSNNEQTLEYLVKSWEGGQKIIGSPRDYQLELFERAKKENTVAVLDTGK